MRGSRRPCTEPFLFFKRFDNLHIYIVFMKYFVNFLQFLRFFVKFRINIGRNTRTPRIVASRTYPATGS